VVVPAHPVRGRMVVIKKWEMRDLRGPPTRNKEGDMGAEHQSAAHAGPDAGERFLLVGAELITFKLRGEAYSAFENAMQAG
jgi:hypothetical protein